MSCCPMHLAISGPQNCVLLEKCNLIVQNVTSHVKQYYKVPT